MVNITGTNLAQSVAGSAQAEKVAARDKKPEKPTAANRRQNDLVVVDVETLEAIRAAKGNGDEEAHDDRQRHSTYTPGEGGKPHDPPPTKHIDLQG